MGFFSLIIFLVSLRTPFLSQHISLTPYFLGFFLSDLLNCFDHIVFSLISPFQPCFAPEIPMFRTVGQTHVSLGVKGKPAYLFLRGFVAEKAAGTHHFTVLHGILFCGEFSGNVFGIIIKYRVDFLAL